MLHVTEYGAGEAPCCRLQALVRFSDQKTAEEFQKQGAALFEETVVHDDADGCCLLSGLAPAGADPDRLLPKLDAMLGTFQGTAGGEGQAELLETRMVSASPSGAADSGISNMFRIVSSAEESEAADDRLILEPGHVFGTGLHPSTRLAVRAIEELAEETAVFSKKALDVGSGSGILALICAKLGAGEVLGIDICPEAIATAERNIRHNRLSDRVRIADTPLADLPGKYDLILANMTVSVLFRVVHDLLARLSREGTLIVSGLQGQQTDAFLELLGNASSLSVKTYTDGPWRALRIAFL